MQTMRVLGSSSREITASQKKKQFATQPASTGCLHFLIPVRLLGRSTPDNISDKLMSKAAAIFTKVARFGVRLHCSIQPYPTRWSPALCAKSSCEMPRSFRSCFSRAASRAKICCIPPCLAIPSRAVYNRLSVLQAIE